MANPDSPHGALALRVDSLAEAAELAATRFGPDASASANALVERVRGRLRHGTNHTVVALAGPTGAGKSTLFNALTGSEVSTTGVKRPTTSNTHAVMWGDGASDLLDWLKIERRHQAEPVVALEGLVLLDLPDFDSTQKLHQMEVDRLIELVDMMIWVVDPQKYADQSLHDQYLRPLNTHAEVMRFVLNKADTLPEPAVVVEDYQNRLAEDGIANATVIPVSATTGDGVQAARDLLSNVVEERRAAVARLDADLIAEADSLAEIAGIASPSGDKQKRELQAFTKNERADLVAGLSRASGIDSAVEIVAEQYKRDAGLATGWPAIKWVNKFRKTPLRSLPSPAASATAHAEVGVALRDAGEATARKLQPAWASAVRDELGRAQPDVLAEISKVPLRAANATRDKPAWWAGFQWLQRLAGLVAIVGAVWLLVLVLGSTFFRLETDPLTPMVNDWLPLPTLLVFAGLALGILLALIAKIPTNIGAARRGRKARDELETHIDKVVDDQVVAPLNHALSDRRELGRLLDAVRNPEGVSSPRGSRRPR